MKSLLRKLIPNFMFSWYHFLLAFLGALIYGFSSKKLIVIGVTGTDGKTTVVHLITETLALTQGRYKVSSVSSIKFKIGSKEWSNKLRITMPGRFKLQKFLYQAVRAGCKYMLLEVTSEGIKQHRHRFIDFDGMVFTNLTKEHIEAHKGFENYKKAKGKAFISLNKSKKKNKFVVINTDDKYGEYYAKLAGDAKKYFYSLKTSLSSTKQSMVLGLLGDFNKYNALAAINTVLALGVGEEKALKIIENIEGLPGRMELVIDKPFKVYVDYAHTPDALEKVYQTLGKGLICVFGSCGGGRDKWKRPEIGKIASNYCKKIILTNEDPYDENPEQILIDIESGTRGKSVDKIIDRRKAINKALSSAKKGDIVIITGKGSESSICVADGKKIPWSDKQVVLEEFKKLRS